MATSVLSVVVEVEVVGGCGLVKGSGVVEEGGGGGVEVVECGGSVKEVECGYGGGGSGLGMGVWCPQKCLVVMVSVE